MAALAMLAGQNLTLTNEADEPEAVVATGGLFADVLHSNLAYELRDEDASMVGIGDQPDEHEHSQCADTLLADTTWELMMVMAWRKLPVLQGLGKPEFTVVIESHGTRAIRVLLGDGTLAVWVPPGGLRICSAAGYLELRGFDPLCSEGFPASPMTTAHEIECAALQASRTRAEGAELEADGVKPRAPIAELAPEERRRQKVARSGRWRCAALPSAVLGAIAAIAAKLWAWA